MCLSASPGAQVAPCLCGGPAGHAGPGPAGSQPVSGPEQPGLRAQHRRGHVETEGHAVVAPCGEKSPLTLGLFLFLFLSINANVFRCEM